MVKTHHLCFSQGFSQVLARKKVRLDADLFSLAKRSGDRYTTWRFKFLIVDQDNLSIICQYYLSVLFVSIICQYYLSVLFVSII